MVSGIPNDNSFFKIDPLPTIPFLTSATTYHKLKFGENYTKSSGLCGGCNPSTRGIFYGGNLGVCQDKNNYEGQYGKWSFKGSWQKPTIYPSGNTFSISPGINYLVDYHRWGNYAAHFGLREVATSLIEPFVEEGQPIPLDLTRKDAVISWAYEFTQAPNRLIFQSIEGVHNFGSGFNQYASEWATILGNGNFGLGLPNPTAQFHLKETFDGSLHNRTLMEFTDYNSNPLLKLTRTGDLFLGQLASTSIQQLLIDPNGKVYTGTVNANDVDQVWLLGGNNITTFPNYFKNFGTTSSTNLRFIAGGRPSFEINGQPNSTLGFTRFYLPVSIGGRFVDDIVDPSEDWSLTLKPIKSKTGSLLCLNKHHQNVLEVSDDVKINAKTDIIGNTNITGIITLKGNVSFLDNGTFSPTFAYFNSEAIFNDDATFVKAITNQLLPFAHQVSDIGIASTNVFNNIYGTTLWAGSTQYSSDRKLKENIEPIENTLAIIKKLNPVKYNFIKTPHLTDYGFIAQEIEPLLPNVVIKPKNSEDNYWVTYIELIPVLTKGIQEQQIIIDSLKQKLDMVFASGQIKESKNINTQKEVLNQFPILFQNHPNPFKGVTFIDYFLPSNSNNAFLRVVDNNGKLIKAFSLNKTGYGQVELDCTNLAPGQYYYSLMVYSKLIDTKSMVIAVMD